VKELRGRLAFNAALLQRFLTDAGAVMRGQRPTLLSFDEVRSAARMEGQAYRGLREIPVAQIRGTVGRVGDFDASFLPARPHLRQRWARLDAAMRRGEAIPPIEVYELGGAYFVKDGHHRVSVARQLGQVSIAARVIEVRTRVPLDGEIDAEQLLRAREYADFLERTRLDRVRPQAAVECSRLGQYDRILEHILGHRYFLGLEQGREVPMPEAAASWYDRVYLPVIQLIREYAILDVFQGRTEADLFLWITARWLELSQTGRSTGPAEAIADILFEVEGLPEPSASLQQLVRKWLGPPRRWIRALPANPPRLSGASPGKPH
jgi:hypothetical protein